MKDTRTIYKRYGVLFVRHGEYSNSTRGWALVKSGRIADFHVHYPTFCILLRNSTDDQPKADIPAHTLLRATKYLKTILR